MDSRRSVVTRRGLLRAAGAGIAASAGCTETGIGGGGGGDGGKGSTGGKTNGSGAVTKTGTDGQKTTGTARSGSGASSSSSGSSSSSSDESSHGQSMTIAILAAGSLQNALSNGLEPLVDVPLQIEAHGSATVARLIAAGQRDPDIVSVADVALFDGPLNPPWHSIFASNAVVIAYNPDTEGGKRIADAGEEGWYEPMIDGIVSLGRTDPDQDPLGYRALFTLELASRYYDDASNLSEKVLKRNQIYPETALISQFEIGSIDAAIAYRSMAIERNYEYVDLPDQIDLSNPRYANEWYSKTSYTLPSGQTIQGGLISYGSTIRKTSNAALDVFALHTTGEYLAEFGFLRREGFPLYEGDVPERVERATGGSNTTQSVRGGRPSAIASTVSDVTILV